MALYYRLDYKKNSQYRDKEELKEAERAPWNIEMIDKDLQYDLFDSYKLKKLENYTRLVSLFVR
tara:strand:+ start:85 stop:276 length:192 start_codon:yes stop_codon:yes gene_type:complete